MGDGRIFLKNRRASLFYYDLSNDGMSLISDTSRWTLPLKSIFLDNKDAKNLKTLDAYTESTGTDLILRPSKKLLIS
jgi:hypothetical protein